MLQMRQPVLRLLTSRRCGSYGGVHVERRGSPRRLLLTFLFHSQYNIALHVRTSAPCKTTHSTFVRYQHISGAGMFGRQSRGLSKAMEEAKWNRVRQSFSVSQRAVRVRIAY